MVTAIMVGAGVRGTFAYAPYANKFPDELKFVGVAEPLEANRERFMDMYHVPEENSYDDWRKIVERERFADCAFVCTQDNDHHDVAIRLLDLGYHVICEKPMSKNIQELREMEEAAVRNDRMLSICHVLRFSDFFVKLKELVDSGRIGKIMHIQHREGVGYYHQAHSFVRGNWRRDDETSPMILQKCCHDMDILSFLIGKRVRSVSSFGSLSYFTEENAPEGAPMYCMDGCPHRDTCPFYAPRIYMGVGKGFCQAVTLSRKPEDILEALKKGPYGRCVFHCDNNVVDHQTVNLLYEDGTTASHTMCAFSKEIEREMTIMGTLGEIKCNMEKRHIELRQFASGITETYDIEVNDSGHGGSDENMVREMVRLVAQDGKCSSRADVSVSVESHVVALLAEESRKQGGKVMEVKW